MKAAIFHPKAREAIRELTESVRHELGEAIRDLQLGQSLGMPLSRPMSEVALGVEELRARDESGSFRVFYYKKSRRGILILHCFAKKTRKTPLREIEVGRRRLREMLDEEEG